MQTEPLLGRSAQRARQVDLLALFSVLWALAAVWHLLGNTLHGAALGPAGARRGRGAGAAPSGQPGAAGGPGRGRDRHDVGGGAAPGQPLAAGRLRRRGHPDGGRHGRRPPPPPRSRGPRRPAAPGRPALPAGLLRLRGVRQAQLGLLRPVGQLRDLLLPGVNGLHRSRWAPARRGRLVGAGRHLRDGGGRAVDPAPARSGAAPDGPG